MTSIPIIAISILVSAVIGFMFGRITASVKSSKVQKIYENIEDYVLLISGMIVLLSIVFSTMGIVEEFASIATNTFGTIVFSWLLTKKSSRIEFEKEEQSRALRAYRHINYIENAANSAYKKIESFIQDDEMDSNTKLMLNSAMDQIKYIQGGINTCKMDWYDMLSNEQQNICKDTPEEEDEEYGTVEVVLSDMVLNQEDA